MFLTYEITVKSEYTIIKFTDYSIRITLYIKTESEYYKIHRLEQMYGQQFQWMGKLVSIRIT